MYISKQKIFKITFVSFAELAVLSKDNIPTHINNEENFEMVKTKYKYLYFESI